MLHLEPISGTTGGSGIGWVISIPNTGEIMGQFRLIIALGAGVQRARGRLSGTRSGGVPEKVWLRRECDEIQSGNHILHTSISDGLWISDCRYPNYIFRARVGFRMTCKHAAYSGDL